MALKSLITFYLLPYSVHVVGLDLHQKLVLIKESSFNLNYKKEKMDPSSFIIPEDVCVIEDDEGNASRAPTEEVHSSIKSKRENGSM